MRIRPSLFHRGASATAAAILLGLTIAHTMSRGPATTSRDRSDLALEWFTLLKAPRKKKFTFENAGHSVVFEQFQSFAQIMREPILPETYHNR